MSLRIGEKCDFPPPALRSAAAVLNLRRGLPRRRDGAAYAGRLPGAAAAGRQVRSSSPAAAATWPPSSRSSSISAGLTTPWLRPRSSGGGMVAARGRPAPTCSSARSRTPPPSTPTPRHMMCTLGRPIPRTANETTPNIVSVVTFCNQATALLRSPPAAAKGSS